MCFVFLLFFSVLLSFFVCFPFWVSNFIAFRHPRRRKLDQEGVDIDRAEDEIVVDAAAGSQFFQLMQGTCPCITKARGGQLGHCLMQAGLAGMSTFMRSLDYKGGKRSGSMSCWRQTIS